MASVIPKRHILISIFCVQCTACFAEETLTAWLEKGYEKVADGKPAMREFQSAIRINTDIPKFWTLKLKDSLIFHRLCSEMSFAFQLSKNYTNARDLIQEAIKAKPANASYRVQLGEVHWFMSNYDLATAAYDAALELKPKSPSAWHGKARCLQNTRKPEKAVRAFERALELSPENTTYLRDLARMVFHRRDYKRALHLLRRAMKLNPSDTSLHCEIGWIYYRTNKLGDALSVFIRQTRRPNADANCWFGLGTVMIKLKRLKEAVAPLKRACDLDPTAVGYWRDYGNVLFRLNRYSEAADAYRKSITRDPEHPVLWHSLGLALEKDGKPKAALSAFKTSADLDAMGDAWADQMHVLNQLDRFKEAQAVGKKALALGTFDPKKPERGGLTNPRYVHRMIADALTGLGQYREALKACDEADKASKKAGDGVYHLCYIQRGDALLGLGEISKARKAYKTAGRGPKRETVRRRLEALPDEK